MYYVVALVMLYGQMGWMEYQRASFAEERGCLSYLELNREMLEASIYVQFAGRSIEVHEFTCMTLEQIERMNDDYMKKGAFL